MTQFEIIKDLATSLRKDEIRSLRRFLQLFEEGSDANQLKSLALLELLLNPKDYSEEKICKKLYGNTSATSLKTFNKMQLRFKDKVFELLTLDINLFRKDVHDELNMAVSETRKMLLEVNVLESKLVINEVIRLYEKIKAVAKKYELYDELLQALSGKMNFLSRLAGHDYKTENITEIMFYDRCRFSLLKAREVYQRLIQRHTAGDINSGMPEYDKAIEELEHEYRYTKSAAVGYILYELITHYQQSLKNFDAAEKACQRVISIISENPSVYRNDRMTKAFLNLATIELFRFKFRQADAAVVRALVYGKGYEALVAGSVEISFFTLFYTGQFAKAESLIDTSMNVVNSNASLWKEKLSFYSASLKTIMTKTHDALVLLQQTNLLEKESVLWNSGIRLMIILNLIDAEKLDAVESHVENFRKFLDRSAKAGVPSDRFMLIAKILGRLVHESFDFNQLKFKEKNNISLLEGNVPQYAWQPKSPEVIIFHLWLASRNGEGSYATLAENWFEGNKKITAGLTLFD